MIMLYLPTRPCDRLRSRSVDVVHEKYPRLPRVGLVILDERLSIPHQPNQPFVVPSAIGEPLEYVLHNVVELHRDIKVKMTATATMKVS